jgi:GT2 family glycosyltransferase
MHIEVIVPIYNALSETERCLDTVMRHSFDDPQSKVTVVVLNDASDEATSAYLRAFAGRCPQVVLLENEKNLGFLGTANRGLNHRRKEKERSEVKILLNSDTAVFPGWIAAFRRCFESDARVGLATAISNNAEGLSAPIPEGWSAEKVAREVPELLKACPSVQRSGAPALYPDVTTAIGFCMGVRTAALDTAGVFDTAFAPGYGEESDLHFRMLAAGFRSVLVTDCFVYHQGHASFSEKKKELVAKNRKLFDQRWGGIYHNELRHNERIPALEELKRTLMESRELPAFDVLFILPTAKPFGGVIVVFETCNRLVRQGVKAGVIVIGPREPVSMPLEFSPIFVDPTGFEKIGVRSKAYVATHYETCQYAVLAHSLDSSSSLVYLIQGYEGWFPGATIDEVLETYAAIPNRIVVSSWLGDMLTRWGFTSTVIPNGIDTGFFYPAPSKSSSSQVEKTKPLRILTLLRHDPQGAFRIAAEVLTRIKAKYPSVEIIGVGNLVERPEFSSFLSEKHVVADRKGMRDLYHRSDIFIDCSMVQGFGLMGLEAMACGVAAVLSSTGGVREYANESNALFFTLGNVDEAYTALEKLIVDADLRRRLQAEGVAAAQRHTWDAITPRYASYLSGALAPMTVENYGAMYRFLHDRHVHRTSPVLGERMGGTRRSLVGRAVKAGIRISDSLGIRPKVEQIVRRFLSPKTVQALRERKQSV